jgi:glycosyltransferase involved in cell wall biosynthesis
MNRLALAQPRVRRSLKAARAIYVSNQTTLNFLPASCHERCMIVPPNALREQPATPPVRPPRNGAPLNLLFVGNCVATRSIPLLLEALERVPTLPWRLFVVGKGPALDDWKKVATAKGMGEKVTFTGSVPRGELTKYYTQADVFAFPALRDSGGSGLLEAMSLGLPVVCCDWGGPAEMVDESSGIKISVRTPEETIRGFATAFERLHAEPSWREALGLAAFERVKQTFSWDHKREVLESTYAHLLGRKR